MTTHQYEEARGTLNRFLGGTRGTLAFTKNTTEAVNIVAQGIGWNKTDRIITTLQDHHSNLLSWYRLKNEGEIAAVDTVTGVGGVLRPQDIKDLMMPNACLIALGHASNIFGTITLVAEIAKICQNQNILLLLDGAQNALHLPINLNTNGCDFFCFSGHKILGPTGTGGPWKSETVVTDDRPAPLLTGGGMVAAVGRTQFTAVDGPGCYEARTPNITGTIGLVEASRYLARPRHGQRRLPQRRPRRPAGHMVAGLGEISRSSPLDAGAGTPHWDRLLHR